MDKVQNSDGYAWEDTLTQCVLRDVRTVFHLNYVA
jgi:hypothetical protein